MTIEEIRNQKIKEATDQTEWYVGQTVRSMAKRFTLEYAKALERFVKRGTGEADIESVLEEMLARGLEVTDSCPRSLNLGGIPVAFEPSEIFYGSVDVTFFWDDTKNGAIRSDSFMFNTWGMDAVSVVDCMEDVGRFYLDMLKVFEQKERDLMVKLMVQEISFAGVPECVQGFMLILDSFKFRYMKEVKDHMTVFTVDVGSGKEAKVEILHDRKFTHGELYSVVRSLKSLRDLLARDDVKISL